MVATFRIYKRISPLAPGRQASHLEFHIQVAFTLECLVKYEIEAPNVRVGGLTAPIPDYIQLGGINHECLSYKQTRWVIFERTAG